MINKKNKIYTSEFLKILNGSIYKPENQEINLAINALYDNICNGTDDDVCLSFNDLSCLENTFYGDITIIKCNNIDIGVEQITTLLNYQVKSILVHFNLSPYQDMMQVATAMEQIYESVSGIVNICWYISYDILKEKSDIEIHNFLFY